MSCFQGVFLRAIANPIAIDLPDLLASELGRNFKQTFGQIKRFIPTEDGVIHHIVTYVSDWKLNEEMFRIFKAEAWVFPFNSPINRFFARELKRYVTRLTIPHDAVNYLNNIAQRVQELPHLDTITVQIPSTYRNKRDHAKFIQFYLTAFQNLKLNSLTFEKGITLSELHAVTRTQSLNSLSLTGDIIRDDSEFDEKTRRAEADAKGSQDRFSMIFGRCQALLSLRIIASGLRDHELTSICTTCSKIQYLSVPYNALTSRSLPAIASLPNLTALNISTMQNLQYNHLTPLTIHALRKLVMRDCFQYSNGSLGDFVSRFRNLNTLDVSGTVLSDADLKLLASRGSKNLHTLVLQRCFPSPYQHVTPEHHSFFARCITKLTCLTELDIVGCQLSPNSFQEIMLKLNNLRKVICGGWHTNEQEDGTEATYLLRPPIDLMRIKDAFEESNKNLAIEFRPLVTWVHPRRSPSPPARRSPSPVRGDWAPE